MKTKLTAAVMTAILISGCGSATSTSDSAVPDTAKPVITIAEKEIKATINGKLNISTNVKVEDDTDGKLKKVDKLEDGKAGYTVDDTKVDLTKAGTYAVVVTAVDSAGNKAKANFDVVVSEAKIEEKTDAEKTSGADKEEKKESSSSSSTKANVATSSQNKSTSSSSGTTSKPSGGNTATTKPSTGGSTSSGSSTTSKPSSSNSGNTGTTSGNSSSSNTGTTVTPPAQKPAEKPADPTPVVCDHTWVEVIQTIHHDAVPEVKHEEPVYETRYNEFQKCAYCGFTSDIHEVISSHCAYCGEEVISPINGEIIKSGSNWYSVYEPYEVQIGTKTVVDKAGTPAYDETVVIGHRCSKCGQEQ